MIKFCCCFHIRPRLHQFFVQNRIKPVFGLSHTLAAVNNAARDMCMIKSIFRSHGEIKSVKWPCFLNNHHVVCAVCRLFNEFSRAFRLIPFVVYARDKNRVPYMGRWLIISRRLFGLLISLLPRSCSLSRAVFNYVMIKLIDNSLRFLFSDMRSFSPCATAGCNMCNLAPANEWLFVCVDSHVVINTSSEM